MTSASEIEPVQANQGKLFVFEGAHNCGKTTLSQKFAERLAGASNGAVIWRAFPGRQQGTLGALIYDLHHRPENYLEKKPSALAIQALHIAAHIDNIQSELLAALDSGTTVVLDRFWWSTWVHGIDTGCPVDLLDQFISIEKQVWGRLDLTVFLVHREEAKTPRIVALYDELAELETARLNIKHIQNDGSMEDALDCAFALLL